MASGTCGNNLTWTLNESTGVLTISGNGEMVDWATNSSVPWYSYMTTIKTVTIENNVTSIGDFAFYCCTGLTNVTIGKNVTSIGKYSFGVCRSLTNIEIPDSVISIGDAAFFGCGKLTNIMFGKNVESIGEQAFLGANVTNIELPDSVISIGEYAFYTCSNLREINIPNDVEIIKNYTFYKCISLTNITIPNSVTSIHDTAFKECKNLNIFYVGAEWEWNEITEIRSDDNITIYFYKGYCGKDGDNLIWEFDMVDTLTISGEGDMDDYSNIKPLSPWYNYKDNIKNINVSEGITCIGRNAFRTCKSLENIVIPNGVTKISLSSFAGCTNLTNIEIPDSVISIGDAAFFGCGKLTNIMFGKNVESIGEQAFLGANVTNIELPDSVISIEDGAFGTCTKLVSVKMGSNIEYIGTTAFENCVILTSFSCKSKKANVEKNVFQACTNLIKETDGKQFIINEATNKQWLLKQTFADNKIEIDSDIELLCEHSVSFSDVGSSVIVTLPLSLFSVSDESFILNDQINNIEFVCENPNVFLGSLGIVDNNFKLEEVNE